VDKTYIFFEPRDLGFFHKITDVYNKLLKKYYIDAAKAFSNNDSDNFFKNYIEELIFPACDYNNDLHCPHTICGLKKCPVLTEEQKDKVVLTLKNAIQTIRALSGVEHSIVDNIHQKAFNLLFTETEVLPFKHDNTLPFYLQFMREISGRKDAEKLVFVSSENSEFNYFRDKMSANAEPKTVIDCVYYQ